MTKTDSCVKVNRLINENSPYLLQHAHNPVDWFPWCEEAFNKAKEENKPIFLSVGYSCCHWCHVMEKESFEDDEVAEILNQKFISIKVDREERPDVDSVYMTACQALTGSGGWPLSIFMTYDKEPFYAGTYFPKQSKYGIRGFIEILNLISDLWSKEKERILNSSRELTNAIKTFTSSSKAYKINESFAEHCAQELKDSYDSQYGGFGYKPKFPTPHNFSFLLKYKNIKNDKKSQKIVENSLKMIYNGGIFDHIGFGFSRYSTDEKWLVPHFEKMLYDNALLSKVYVEAYQTTKDEQFKDIAEKIFDYILREMTNEEGAFYSAEDADSEGIEGKFYVWTKEEIMNILGEEDTKLFCKCFDITESGNFEGKNIPNLIEFTSDELFQNKQLKDRIEKIRQKLFEYRENRIHPFKDDKILTSWNALMIASFAYAGRVFDNQSYIRNAEKCYEFIENNLITKEGRILARYRNGEAKFLGYLDDYVFIVSALIELYESTFKIEYLKKAMYYNQEMMRLFWDNENHGLFKYANDTENLIVRPKEIYDSAIPSANSSAIFNLLFLADVLQDEDLREKANDIFEIFGEKLMQNPSSYTNFASAYLKFQNPGIKITIIGDNKNEDTKEFIKLINNNYDISNTIILYNNEDEMLKICPYLKDYKMIENKSTAYVCKNFECYDPVNNVEKLRKILK